MSDAEDDRLGRAYEERSAQLYDARAALAEAVSTVTAELNRCREERDRALAEVQGLREHTRALEDEVDKQQRHAADMDRAARAAQARLATLERVGLVRWIVRARTIVDRLRGDVR